MGKRARGVLIAGLVTLSACSTSNRGVERSPASTPTTARARATTTTTTRPDFSFDDSVPPPKLVNTGTDYAAILRSLSAYCDWLAGHQPEPARASRVLAPGSKLLDGFARDLTHLRDSGTREIETLNGPKRYTILSRTPDAFSARAVENVVSHKWVDANGRVTREVRWTTPTTYLMLAVLVDGHWHLAAIDVQQPANVHL